MKQGEPKPQSHYPKVLRFVYVHPLSVLTIFLLVCSIIVYLPFIIGGMQYYLFCNYDGYTQTWPYLSNFLGQVAGGKFPFWSFSIGLGAPVPISLLLAPLNFLYGLCGETGMLYAGIFLQTVKILAAGLFFFLFLEKLQLHRLSCFLFAVLYAFSGIVIARGPWLSYGFEAVCAALILFAAERYFQDGRWILLTLSLALLFYSQGIVTVYQYAIFLFSYLLVRFLIAKRYDAKRFWALVLRCGGIFLLAVLLTSFSLIPSLTTLLDTPRFENSAQGLTAEMLAQQVIGTPALYVSELLQFLSSNSLGGLWDYSGYGAFKGIGNYLEAPIFYCGLLTLLLVPQTLGFAKGAAKRGIIAGLVLVGAYLSIPLVRLVLNGFVFNSATGISSFKMSTLWICILLLCVAAFGFNRLVCDKNQLSRRRLILTGTAVLGLLLICLAVSPVIGLTPQFPVILLSLLFLATVFVFSYRYKRGKLPVAMAALALFECILFSFVTVSDQFDCATRIYDIVSNTKSWIFSSDIRMAIEGIKSEDTSFYRINNFEGQNESDPLFGDYYDSKYYSTFVPAATGNFLDKMSLVQTDSSSQAGDLVVYSGLSPERFGVNTLLGYKYLVCSPDANVPFGYELCARQGELDTYRNRYALPLGFTYENAFNENSVLFEQQNPNMRDLIVLDALAVPENFSQAEVDTDRLPENIGFIPDVTQMYCAGIDNFVTDDDGNISGVSLGAPVIVLPLEQKFMNHSLDIRFEVKCAQATQIRIYYSTEEFPEFSESRAISKSVDTESRMVSFSLPSGVTQLRIDPGTVEGPFEISKLEVDAVDANAYASAYQTAAQNRLKEPFIIDSFTQDKIDGWIETSGERILFLSIPYSPGWTAEVDGVQTNIIPVNYGFCGIPIASGGIHTIELRFVPPGFFLGLMISFASLLTLAILAFASKKGKNLFILPDKR